MNSENSSAEPTSPPAAVDTQSPSPNKPTAYPSAVYDVSSHLRLWPIAIIGLTADLWTKHWAFSRLNPVGVTSRPFDTMSSLVTFRRSLNPGALFGLGKGMTPLFIAASILALGFVLYLFYHCDRSRRSLHIALGLVLAGALGNLYDRAFMLADVVKYTENGQRVEAIGKITNPGEKPIIMGVWPEGGKPLHYIHPRSEPEIKRQGVVRDFIKMEPHLVIGKHRIDLWPWVFNIADVLLVAGVALLMLNFWWERREEQANQSPPAVDSPAAPQ